MNAPDARIIVHQDPTTQQVVALTEEPLTLGREANNDVVLLDVEASRAHARISFQAGGYFVEDLNSTNGTFVNGRRIQTATALSPGDVIEIGEMVRIVYEGPGSDIGETLARAPSSSRNATMAMSEDLATFSEPLPPIFPDDVAFQEAEPQLAPAAGMPVAPAQTGRRPPGSIPDRRYLAIFGCLIVLAAIACLATILLVDALDLVPDAFYCGPARGLFEFLGFIMDCG